MPIKKMILGKYLNFRLKLLANQERTYDFAAELNQVKKILVILPALNEYTEPNQIFVKSLSSVFQDARISTFVSSTLEKRI